jgi:hypothetical protein
MPNNLVLEAWKHDGPCEVLPESDVHWETQPFANTIVDELINFRIPAGSNVRTEMQKAQKKKVKKKTF